MTIQTLIWRRALLHLVSAASLGWLAIEGCTLALIALTVLITTSLKVYNFSVDADDKAADIGFLIGR